MREVAALKQPAQPTVDLDGAVGIEIASPVSGLRDACAPGLALDYYLPGRVRAKPKRFPDLRARLARIPPNPDPRVGVLVNMKKPPRTPIRGGFVFGG